MPALEWLFRRMVLCKSYVDMETVYATYKLECHDNLTYVDKDRKAFTTLLLAVFPEVSRKKVRKGSDLSYIYTGISLKPLGPLNVPPNTSFEKLSSHVQKDFKVKEVTTNTMTCTFETRYYSNGESVIIEIVFKNDLTFSTSIKSTDIDLKSIGISNKFAMNGESINLICDILRRLKLCCGSDVNKGTRMTRFHLIEKWKGMAEENPSRKIRTILCARVVPFTSREQTCIKCKRMTINEKKVKEPSMCSEPLTSNARAQLHKLMPGASEEMLDFLVSQSENVGVSPTRRRWDQPILSKCLELYSRSPIMYKHLRESKMLVLPSPGILILYKNRIKHKIGFHDEIFRWMHAEAERIGLGVEGKQGGIILDEMSIQEDISFTKTGDVLELVGFENVGDEAGACNTLRKGENSVALGTHALQFIFLGNTGFRFPFGHFLTRNVSAWELQPNFWLAVDQLMVYGFNVNYVCMDGAQSNRSFMNMNIKKGNHSMLAYNIVDLTDSSTPVVFLMDPSHLLKKIRNGIMKSGVKKGCTRHLTLHNGEVVNWQMWVDAAEFDQHNALQLHRRLTSEHICPSSQAKMRNHLAEQVLDSDMLALMIEYKSSIENGNVLDGAIELLRQTSKMVKLFKDRKPIRCIDDERLSELNDINKWFLDWTECVESRGGTGPEKASQLLSRQCMEDAESCLTGLVELCRLTFENSSTASITPALINSDVVENHFCQQRATYNGANSNPNALQYQNNINSIIIGQNIVSHKSNVGNTLRSPALSFAITEKGKRKAQSSVSNSKCKSIRL